MKRGGGYQHSFTREERANEHSQRLERSTSALEMSRPPTRLSWVPSSVALPLEKRRMVSRSSLTVKKYCESEGGGQLNARLRAVKDGSLEGAS